MSTTSIPTPPMLPARRAQRWAWVGIAVAVAGLVYVYFIDPVHSIGAPPCVFYSLTGFYCPGCGGTRAMHALLHGHVLSAIAFNPLIVVAIPVGVSVLLRAALLPGESPRRMLSPVWIWTIFFALIGYWIARNIPAYPFTLLAP